jgi:hypothetical protein
MAIAATGVHVARDVIALFAFIVSGVFLIADPAFLAAGDDADQAG